MYREPIVMGRKLGLKSMVWTRRKKETSNQKRMKKQEFKNCLLYTSDAADDWLVV